MFMSSTDIVNLKEFSFALSLLAFVSLHRIAFNDVWYCIPF